MKKYIFSLSLLALIFFGCEPIERLNVNNPVCCMLDSISIHYYLTTKKKRADNDIPPRRNNGSAL